jgi:hypothetical protein
LVGLIDHANPGAPEIRETFGKEDPIKSVPANRVKGFTEIKLEHHGRRGAAMTDLNNAGSIDKVLSDRAPKDISDLVRVDKEGHKVAKAKGETFRVDFETIVFERYRAEVVSTVGSDLSEKEDNMRLIYRPEVGVKAMEFTKVVEEIIFNIIPISIEESLGQTHQGLD